MIFMRPSTKRALSCGEPLEDVAVLGLQLARKEACTTQTIKRGMLNANIRYFVEDRRLTD